MCKLNIYFSIKIIFSSLYVLGLSLSLPVKRRSRDTPCKSVQAVLLRAHTALQKRKDIGAWTYAE